MTLDVEQWAKLKQEALWLKRFDLKNLATVLKALLGGNQEESED